MMKKLLKGAAILIGAAAVLVVGLVVFLTVTEFKPEDRETASFVITDKVTTEASVDQEFTVFSWNTGYGGLGEESDFFMDGGEMVNPPSQEIVEKNMDGIVSYMKSQDADAWLLQEVDQNSSRTDGVAQYELYRSELDGNGAYAYNYKCAFVPIPVPPMGRVESGIATITQYAMDSDAVRISLPCPFSWPTSAANLKRCLLVTRTPLEGSDKELVYVNLHLEAYDDGEGKIAQTELLMEVLQAEYEKGNYVIAGGDFNQTFPGALENYPVADEEKWTPGTLETSILPEGWEFACDTETATCRLLDQPYCEDCQLYVIDGFIVSPNVNVESVETVDLDFQFSDHNPVKLQFTLNS